MKPTHRYQIEYLKKRLVKGEKGKQLFERFLNKFQLGIKTFERRVAIARAEMGITRKPPFSWVMVNLGYDEKHPQNATQKNPHNTSFISPQQTNIFPNSNNSGKHPQNSYIKHGSVHTETTLKNNAAICSDKSPESIIAKAAKKLLHQTGFDTKDCMMMMSRFALGQFTRKRLVRSNGQMVEIDETPTLSARYAAVRAMLKYNMSVAGL